MDKKKIFLISPPFVAVPPKEYGGAERVVYDLIKSSPNNIKYTLLAPKTSKVDCELKSISEIPLFDDPTYNHSTDRLKRTSDTNKLIINHLKNSDFDLVHSVDYENPSLLIELQEFNKPILVSVRHAILPRIEDLINQFKNKPLIHFNMLSKNHAESFSHLGTFPFIYNGLNLEKFEQSNTKLPFILSIGDTKPIKGHIVAAQIAKKTENDLIIAGSPAYPEAQEYFNNHIKKIIDLDFSKKPHQKNELINSIKNNTYNTFKGKVIYIGAVNDVEKKPLLSKASFVNMLGELEQSSKYFDACPNVGLEALLSRTKLLTTINNPASEFIRGTSGYIVNSIDDAIRTIKRSDIFMNDQEYSKIVKDFNSETMANNYSNLYLKILSGLST